MTLFEGIWAGEVQFGAGEMRFKGVGTLAVLVPGASPFVCLRNQIKDGRFVEEAFLRKGAFEGTLQGL